LIRFQDIIIDRSKQTIVRDGRIIYFPRWRGGSVLFQLACALLLGGPMTRTAHFDLLYDDREDGGPMSGTEAIEVMFCKIAERFSLIDVELLSDRPFALDRRFWAEPMALPKSFDKSSGLEAAE
jgi:hypothetical protein